MTILDELKTGSFRGVPFFLVSTSAILGFNVVDHDYPGSSNFIREQISRKPTTFSMECMVLFSERERFENAINTQGSAILSHPEIGPLSGRVGECTRSSSVNKLGVYEYSIPFAVEIGFILPTVSGISSSVINNLRSTLVTSTTAYIKTSLGGFGF